MNSSQLSGTSLKTKVISIMLLAVISLFVVSNYFFQFFIDEIEQQHGELLVKQQLNTVLERSRVFFEQDSKLISQALLRNDFQSWMKEASNAVLQERAISAIQHNCEVNQCSGWFIFDHKTRNGFDWNHSKEDYFASPLIPGRDVWYDEFIESGKDFLVDVNVHPLDRQYYAFFDYLVKEDGQILGVVGNYIAIEQLVSAILDNPKEGPVNVIIDNRRKFRVNPSIARYDEQLEILATINNKDIKDVLRTRDEAVFQALLSDLKEQANTSVQSLSIYGTQYLTAVNYMPDLDWYFITLYPKSQLTNAIDTIPFLIYSLSFILVFVLLTLFIFNNQLFQPMLRIESVVSELASGNYSHRIAVTKGDELGHLAEGINSMAEEISSNLSRIQHQNEKLNEAIEQANSANQAKTQFLANMSHELRSPMNAVLGFAQLGIDTDDEAIKSDYLTKIKSSGEHLLKVINDILDFSKIESREFVIEKLPFQFSQVVDEVIHICELSALEKNLTLSIELDEKIPTLLKGDSLRIKQTLINLLNNAIKFTESGTITLAASSQVMDEHVRLDVVVEDTGIGMSSNQISNLFQAFSQADSSITRIYGGTGLGLAICKELIEAMGGHISVSSQPGLGSKFSFYILLDPVKPKYTQVSKSDSVDIEKLKQDTSGKLVLVVEDNEFNQTVAKAMLEMLQFDVEVAENGEIAVSLARERDYQFIFMDVQMPVLDGFAATRLIREFNKDVCVIGLSANAAQEDYVNAIAHGMDDYITKPIDRMILFKTIARYVVSRV